jgi:membrane fusion protein, multidrug efflux system
MKTNLIFSLFVFGTVLAACGGGEPDQTDSNLADLVTKRDSLKNELAIVNAQIAALDTTKADLTPLVTATVVEQKDFVHKVEVQGAVETDQNVLLSAETQGTIRVIHVKEGQKVSKGQALVTIDSEILASSIDEVETQLEMATYMFEKQEKLMQEGVGVEIEYEQAKNQKKSLEKRLQTMRSQKGKTIVRAPFSGVIDDIMVSLGDMASPMVPMLRLVNNQQVQISASLSENLLGAVRVGSKVDLVIPSMNDTVINATVSYKGNFIDPVNRTFRIQVDIKNNKLLLPNQVAQVNVVDFYHKDALVVATESILQDTKDNNFVYKMKADGDGFVLEKVFVRIEKSYKGQSSIIPVTAGQLKANDQVVLSGAKGITESDRVKLQ